jgi:hypothetical protein
MVIRTNEGKPLKALGQYFFHRKCGDEFQELEAPTSANVLLIAEVSESCKNEHRLGRANSTENGIL